MNEVTRILNLIDQGNANAADELLPLVYDELRKLARHRLNQERPGQTLQATALVHEAYLQLVGDSGNAQHWKSRGHFFAAAAEAMRRILIQNVRRKRALKRGGDGQRVDLNVDLLSHDNEKPDILELNDALELLVQHDPMAANLVKLRIFAGLSVDEAGEAMGLAHTSAYRQWAYAQAWLRNQLKEAIK